MKRILRTIVVMAVALLVIGLTACGGKKEVAPATVLDEETVQVIDEIIPENGLLGDVAREIVYNMMTIESLQNSIPTGSIDSQIFDKLMDDPRFESYAKNQMSSSEKNAFEKELESKTKDLRESLTEEKEEAKARWRAADSTWKVRWEEIVREQKDIPTEIEEDAPLKLIQPFRIKELTSRSLIMACIVETTIDRGPIYSSRASMPTLNLLKEDGESYRLESRDLSSGSPIKAGTQLTLDLEVVISKSFTKNLQERFFAFANFIRAEKLTIEWNQPYEIKGVWKGELGIFGLKGPVKECLWKNGDTETKYEFNSNGKWIAENGEKPWENYPIVDRDFSRNIISMSNGDEGQTFQYNSNNLISKREYQYMDGGSSAFYFYNADGDCTKCRTVYDPEEEGDDGVTIYKYTILERDDHQNWTKRKDQDGNIETRQITYY